jgi:hypothetical protein
MTSESLCELAKTSWKFAKIGPGNSEKVMDFFALGGVRTLSIPTPIKPLECKHFVTWKITYSLPKVVFLLL